MLHGASGRLGLRTLESVELECGRLVRAVAGSELWVGLDCRLRDEVLAQVEGNGVRASVCSSVYPSI